MLHTVGIVLIWILGLAIIAIGIAYLRKSEANAEGFGLPAPPAEDVRGWWQVKGIRDVASGALVIAFALADSDGLGLLALVLAIIPFGDAWIVLSNGGKRSVALGIHGATALALLVAAALLTWG